MTRGLGFLRHNEKLTDLRFLCSSGNKKAKSVMAHKAVFAQHSKLLADFFDVCKREQVCNKSLAVVNFAGFNSLLNVARPRCLRDPGRH